MASGHLHHLPASIRRLPDAVAVAAAVGGGGGDGGCADGVARAIKQRRRRPTTTTTKLMRRMLSMTKRTTTRPLRKPIRGVHDWATEAWRRRRRCDDAGGVDEIGLR